MAETNHTPAKPDIDALFQSVGSKLGWFQFKDVDSAIKSLSQSGKKKSSRSRVFETSAQKKTPSKNFRKPSKDKDVTKKKSSRKKPKSTIESHANQSSKIVTGWTDDKSLSVDHSMKSSPEVPHGVSIASSPENIPVESTRIGSSVFRTDSNSFVNLTLSPVNACDSVSNIEELSDSYKALKINAQRRKSRQSRGGELDLTEHEQKYTTCFPEDDEIFYSVLDPKGSNSSTSSQQKSGSQSSQGSEQSEYVEVEDKAVSTGSLELALCDNEDLDYEQDRTFFTSWAVPQQERHKKNNVNTSDKNSEDQINDQLLLSDKKLDSDSLEEMASSSISKKCGSVEESSSMSGSSSGSGYCEVEDKCVGPSPSGSLNDSQMSAHSENSLGRSSPVNASKQILQNDCLSKNTSLSDSPSVNSSLSDILADGSPENDSPQNHSPQNHSPHHDPSSGNSPQHELIPNPLNTTKYFDSVDRRISSLHFSTDVSRRSSVYHDATEELELPSIDSGVEPKGYLVTSGVESLVDLSVTDSGSATSQRACENGNKTKGRPAMEQSSSGHTVIYSSDSSDDDLESFLSKVKTPLRERIQVNNNAQVSLDDFVVDDDDDDILSNEDDEEEEGNSGFFHVNVDRKMDAPKHSRRKMHNSSAVRSYRHVIEIDSDSDEENFALPKPKNKAKPASKETFKTPKPLLPKHKDTKPLSSVTPRMSDHVTMMSFLKSLSPTVPDNKKDLEAGRYVRQFSKLREELTQKLFVLYNNTVFDNKLPKDLPIKWNARLLKTAGYCRYKRHRNSSATVWQSVEIELSTKVCDSAERVRDTLIHELCHAAVWIINGTRDGHGPYWKYWARKSNFVHPELPVINRCHNYSITTKYTYKCVQCGYEIGRHSKSLDTVKKVCGLCRGRFELLVSGKSSTSSSKEASGGTPYTPRAPSKFALFVKENYKTIKQSNSDFKHSDVMKALSKQFAEKNRIKDD